MRVDYLYNNNTLRLKIAKSSNVDFFGIKKNKGTTRDSENNVNFIVEELYILIINVYNETCHSRNTYYGSDDTAAQSSH
jgi:hypothetical protein